MPLAGEVRERRQCPSAAPRGRRRPSLRLRVGRLRLVVFDIPQGQAPSNPDGTLSQGRLILERGGGLWGVYNDRCCFIVSIALLCYRFIFERWQQARRRMGGLRGIWDSKDSSVKPKGTFHTLVAAGNRRNPVLSGSVPGTWLGGFFARPRMRIVGIGVTHSDYRVQE